MKINITLDLTEEQLDAFRTNMRIESKMCHEFNGIDLRQINQQIFEQIPTSFVKSTEEPLAILGQGDYEKHIKP